MQKRDFLETEQFRAVVSIDNLQEVMELDP